jgi:glutamine synthetase
MIKHANPHDNSPLPQASVKQTIEFRAGDGSADVYSFLAGLIVAAKLGLEMPNSLTLAEKLYVDVNIFDKEHENKLNSLESLPESCYESAISLEKYRKYFEKDGIFPAGQLDNVIKTLKSYNDINLSEDLYGNSDAIKDLVEKYLDCM